MAEKMVLTRALDERDFLYKKIAADIRKLNLVTVKRNCDPKTKSGLTVEEFEKEAKSQYQSVSDNIDRYKRLCTAIVLSNANTEIDVDGEKMTVAAAIKLRDELNGRVGDQSLDMLFVQKLESLYVNSLANMSEAEKIKDSRRDAYLQTIISTKGSSKDNKVSVEDIELADKTVEGLTPEFIDPLGLKNIADTRGEHLNKLIDNINTAIKISNATVEIEF